MSGRMLKVGEIAYYPPKDDTHIGIHEGTFRMKMKVKVGICKEKNVNKKEIENLLKLDGHKFVQKLYSRTICNSKCFLALETFDVTLVDHINKFKYERIKIDPISLIRGITSGLNYLHDIRIVHGNICSKNIGICYKRKCAKIFIGFDDPQKGVALILTQPQVEDNLIKKDISDLSNVIIFILDQTMDFSVSDLIKTLKQGSDSNSNVEEFFKWISVNGQQLNLKDISKLSLIQQITTEYFNSALSCRSILKNQVFWKNRDKYEKFKEIALQWKEESPRNIEYINRMGQIFLEKCHWITKLPIRCQNTKYYINDVHKMTALVKCVAPKIKYYRNEENSGVLRHEHILYFLEKFPYLLTFMVIINNNICNKKGFLDEKFVRNNLPTELIIPSKDITKNKLLKKSNAEVYDGKYKNLAVALKRILKEDFKLNEIKNIIKLKTRLSQICKSCEQERCENIISFHGCYETDEFVWIVLERAEKDFKDFKFSDQKQKLQVLFDAVKGLECLHANSISHLDIKPGNILVVKRDKKLVGCLADFGESLEAIKKTYTRSKFRGTDGYIAPELEEVIKDKHKTKPKSMEHKKPVSLNYSKCDIYSLGMVIKKDYMESMEATIEPFNMDLLLLEELVNYMTETDPTCRPDAEAVRKNPVFWNTEQKLKFLLYVKEYGENHTTDPKKKRLIENMIRFRRNWISDVILNAKIEKEIEKYVKKKKIDQEDVEQSIFCLVELILFIRSPNAAKPFQETRKVLNASNDEFYLNFWFKNFEISFLYYYMHDVLKLNRDFYSTDQPIRQFKRTENLAMESKLPILVITPSTSTFMLADYMTPGLRELVKRAFSRFRETNADAGDSRALVKVFENLPDN